MMIITELCRGNFYLTSLDHEIGVNAPDYIWTDPIVNREQCGNVKNLGGVDLILLPVYINHSSAQ